MGGESPPTVYIKIKICERMHWTFTEYDEQPANEIAALLEVWNLEAQWGRKAD